jgi:hypothetical protein
MTPSTPDFTPATAPQEPSSPTFPPNLAAALVLAQHLRQLDDRHAAALGMRRSIALLATEVLLDDSAPASKRQAQRVLDWLDREGGKHRPWTRWAARLRRGSQDPTPAPPESAKCVRWVLTTPPHMVAPLVPHGTVLMCAGPPTARMAPATSLVVLRDDQSLGRQFQPHRSGARP